MKAANRFVFLATLFNLCLITLPVATHAGCFSFLNKFLRSFNNILSGQTLDLVDKIEELNDKPANVVSKKKDLRYDEDEKKLADPTNNDRNQHSINHMEEVDLDGVKAHLEADKLAFKLEKINNLNNIVNKILTSRDRCDGIGNSIKRFFGFRNPLEAIKRGTGVTPLIAAVKATYEDKDKYEDIVAKLLQKKVAIDDQDASGKTALMWAIELEDLHSVQQLLRAGADITKEDNNQNSALTMALAKYINLVYNNTIYRSYDIPNKHPNFGTVQAIVINLMKMVLKKELMSKVTIGGQDIYNWLDTNVPKYYLNALTEAARNQASFDGTGFDRFFLRIPPRGPSWWSRLFKKKRPPIPSKEELDEDDEDEELTQSILSRDSFSHPGETRGNRERSGNRSTQFLPSESI